MARAVLPGLVDVHVHIRCPGGEHKETVATATAAALAGGFTAILGMPNTDPPITDGAALDAMREVHARGARCDVGLFVGATPHNSGTVSAAAGQACGLKIYVDDTFGPLRVTDLASLQAHFRAWPRGRPIVAHAEGQALASVIGLSAAYRKHVHIAHVSRADEIRLIAAAKEAGLPVSCEVAPHHLFLTESDADRLRGFGEVRPRLATALDRDTLWQHLDVIDCIATDHAPHTRAEKESPSPPPGMPGLETALPLMLTAVHDGILTLDRLVELMSTSPARIFGVRTPTESEVEVEIGPLWQLPDRGYQCRADWSAFAGCDVRGSVRRVVLRGQVAWDDGVLRARPGSGRLLP